jgi:hypothetical protein
MPSGENEIQSLAGLYFIFALVVTLISGPDTLSQGSERKT